MFLHEQSHTVFCFDFLGFVSTPGINDSWHTVGRGIFGLCDDTLVPDCAYSRCGDQHSLHENTEGRRTSVHEDFVLFIRDSRLRGGNDGLHFRAADFRRGEKDNMGRW